MCKYILTAIITSVALTSCHVDRATAEMLQDIQKWVIIVDDTK